MSGSAVAAGDVRSTCGNCGSALVIERGGVVRLAEPPPGPAAAPQLIVPPTFEPPSHATAMREFAIADEAPSAFYGTHAPNETRDFNALLGADVRAYVDEGRAHVEPPVPSFSGPATFGSDVDNAITERTPALASPDVVPDFTAVPATTHVPISVPFEVPTVISPALAPEAPPFSASDAPYAAEVSEPPRDAGEATESLTMPDYAAATEAYAPPEAPAPQSYTAEEAFGAPESVASAPADVAETPTYMATSAPTYQPPAYAPPPYEAPVYETPVYEAPVYDASVYPARGLDGEARPPALMFPQSHVGGMTGPAREAEPSQLAAPTRPAAERAPVEAQPAAEPMLLTDASAPPELLNLTSAMPEWSGESLDEAAPYVPPFSNPVSEDELDNAVADSQRRAAYPTPDSYFDASDPLATAEADMYAGHAVVAPTEMVGDAFTAMVPPVGTYVPNDSATIDLTPDAATRAAAEEAEDLAVLRAGRRKRLAWATAACFVFAVGAASFAASRGYLDGVIGRVKGEGAKADAPMADGRASSTDTPVADGRAPSADKPIADGRAPSTDTPIADGRAPSTDTPVADGRTPGTDKPMADGREPGADKPVADGRAPSADQPAMADPTVPPAPVAPTSGLTAEPKPVEPSETPAKPEATKGPPSKALNACYTKGNRLLNAKKVNLAIRELNKCLDIDPTYGRTYRSLGVAYMLLGRERSAILAYEKFVDYDPQHKDVAKVREIIADYYRRRKN